MSDLQSRLAALPPEKRRLLELLRAEKSPAEGEPRLPKPARSATRSRLEPFALLGDADRRRLPAGLVDAYPLTSVQRGMLYHMELTEDRSTPDYHNVNGFHLRAPFDLPTFTRAVQRIVDRHPVLRTAFDLTSYGEPLQLVHPTATMPIEVEDLRALDPAARSRHLAVFTATENRRLIDLGQPPLMRFFIHRLTDETFQFTFTEPHAISDGWSTTSTLAEIFSLYLALLRGEQEPELPPTASSYGEFVELERKAIAEPAHRIFWERKLEGSSLLHVPRWAGETPPADPTYVRKPTLILPEPVRAGLTQLVRRAGVSFKSLLVAAHVKVLSLLTGQRDILTGLVTHGRPEELDGELIRGLFLNTVPLRVRLAAGSWLDLARLVFAAEVELLPHRRYPLVGLKRERSEKPLFETSFSLLHFHAAESLLKTREIELMDYGHSDQSTAHYTFSATFVYDEIDTPTLALTLEHQEDLQREQMALMIGYYARVLSAMAAAPDASHDACSLLGDDELHRLLVDWGQGPALPLGEQPLHHLVEIQVATSPESTALVFEDQWLSYRELDRRAERLAGHLRRRFGVGPDSRVAVFLERSAEMIIAILGVLKAGGAYVPLDAEYPRERLAFLAQDARPPVIVTQDWLCDRLPDLGVPVLCLERAWAQIAAEIAPVPAPELRPENLAYVIYTSGSTGRPKGVMVSHQAIKNRLLWMQHSFPVAAGDRLLFKTPFSFDASVWEIFLPLLVGGAVVIARPGGQRESAYLLQKIREQRVTVLQLVPSMLQVVAEEPELTTCTSLRWLFSGGELLARELAQRSLQLLPQAELCNLYGPTETAIDAAAHLCRRDALGDQPSIPIGRALSNLRLYVVGRGGHPMPTGSPGELRIGGISLARGYQRRPALTAAAFLPDALTGETGARLYATGDLVRFWSDGRLEYLGRIDQQVKIRGFRIEPAEIEARLSAHPQVKQAVISAWEREGGSRDLVAYVVARDEELSSTALREFVGEELPEHMVPAAVVFLDEMPRTPSGKLDRKALPAPDAGTGAAEVEEMVPRSPVEELLAQIWAEVLGVEKVGMHSGFFALGGHSLHATQIMIRVKKLFGVRLRIRLLFEAPTVAALAKTIETALRTAEEIHLPPLVAVPHDRPLPLSFAQQRLWLVERLAPGGAAYNIPMILRLHGHLDRAALARCLDEVVRRHAVLRTTFAEHEGEPVQILAAPAGVPLPRLDLRRLAAAERERELLRLVRQEAARPFDLERGPILRCRLIELDPRDHVVSFTLHHIAGDGWSTGLLVREVTALYAAFRAGLPSPLPELPLQYADFAQWQRSWLHGAVLEQQLDYWRQRLAGATNGFELPGDRPRPAGRAHRAGYSSWRFSAALLGALETLSGRCSTTLFMTMLAAFDVVLAHLTGSEDVVIGTDVANREHAGTEGLVGFFVNQLVLRCDLGGNPTFVELLERVREVALGAYAHQDLPFERLVEELLASRDPSRSPLFQIKLVLQNAPSAHLELPGLTVSGVGIESGLAKSDLLLNLAAGPEGLAAAVEHSADLYDGATIDRLLESYQLVLEAVVADPETRLEALRARLREHDDRRRADHQARLREVTRARLRDARPRQEVAT